MSISQDMLQRSLDFLGYGTLDAPIWFLGMEESFRERPGFDHQRNLEVHAKFDRVMDVQIAHELLEARYWLAPKLNVSSVWRWMAKFTRALIHHAQDWESVNEAKGYIRKKLGREAEHGGETFLLELLPLPRRNSHEWPLEYRLLFPDRDEYRNNISTQRIQLIRSLLDIHSPHYLFCYGQLNYPYYRKLAEVSGWEFLAETKIELGIWGSTTIVMTPFFGNGQLSHRDAGKLVNYLKDKEVDNDRTNCTK